jgi:hypothetical protein
MVGIDSRNKNILDQKYICPKCLLILQDPVQLSICGHRQCQSCIDTQQRWVWLQNNINIFHYYTKSYNQMCSMSNRNITGSSKITLSCDFNRTRVSFCYLDNDRSRFQKWYAITTNRLFFLSMDRCLEQLSSNNYYIHIIHNHSILFSSKGTSQSISSKSKVRPLWPAVQLSQQTQWA